ncbi:MgtC/SapB family protein [Salinibaculum rarum]|uniref:MgtC/SapB family protein n=1 Tax=Salinibaculum rarum TaxID=3058903 RepID=UPI0026601DD1|nr:DUF4010 domain-containing protein [Salinibaculum sp. KK48]
MALLNLSLSLPMQVFVAAAVGALVGLEREQSESGGTFAGSRTFPLLALYGALVGAFFPAVLPVALAVLVVPLTAAYLAKVVLERDLGLTTLTAALLTVVLGAMATHSARGTAAAVIVGGVVTALLSAKATIHGFAEGIDEAERRASIKFVLVVLVVLPLLPDRAVDELFGLNPRFVWLMVVFVSGLSFAAYVLSRVVGTERGIAATGVLGGFVSSTATAVSMAEQTAENPSLYQVCAFSTVVAATVMFPRALLEVVVVNRSLALRVAVPLGVMTVVAAAAAVVVYWRATGRTDTDADIENPFRLKPALFFGLLFAVILLVSEQANAWFGSSGVYATAFVSGLADVDAMTITLSRLAAEGTIDPAVATTGIVIAAVANTLVKAGIVWVIGTRKLGKLVTAVLATAAVAGLATVLVL